MAKIFLVEEQVSEYNDQYNNFVDGYIVIGAFKSLNSAEKFKWEKIKKFLLSFNEEDYEDGFGIIKPYFNTGHHSLLTIWLNNIGASCYNEVDYQWILKHIDEPKILQHFMFPYKITEMEVQK